MTPRRQQYEREKQYFINQMMKELPGIDPACTVMSGVAGRAAVQINGNVILGLNAIQYGHLHAQGYIDEGIEKTGDSNDSIIHRREHKFTEKGLAVIRGGS